MKKIYFIIGLLILSLFPTIAYGNSSSCKIEDNPATSITNYIKNTRQVITNINSDLLSRTDEKSESKLSISTSRLNGMYNEMVNWDGFFTDFDYYVGFQLFNSVPQEIKRDLELLENETEGLRRYLDTVIKRGYADISLKKETICDGINNCDLEGNTLGVIGNLIKNNTELTTLYKQIVTNPDSTHNGKIILTEEPSRSFIDNLITHYGGNTITDCAAPEGEDTFSKRIETTQQVITQNSQKGTDGIEQWRNAFKLLIGQDIEGETYAERERELLKNELQNQGLSLSAQKIMLENLDEFNSNGFYSLDNNFVANSFESIYKGGKELVTGFNQAISGAFPEDKTAEINAQASVGIDTLLDATDKRQIENDITERLDILHRTHMEFAAVDSVANQKAIANIIKMHISLEASKNKLQDTCELAVKVCNSQGRGKGNCGTCK